MNGPAADPALDSALIGEAPAREAGPREFFALMKPRVMSLVLFTGLAGMIAAPGAIHPVLACAALLFMALGAGGAAALNMWYEADRDALMPRTANRVLPQGRMEPGDALGFGIGLSLFATAGMAVFVSPLAALLLAATIAFYVLVYTVWLKPRSAQNIVIGGAAGALPPVIGWAAAAYSLALEPIALFAIIFLWTPPHFWALALLRAREYEAAGLPMLPVTAGPRATAVQSLFYAVLLLPAALAPAFLGGAGPIYAAAAALLSLGMIAAAARLLHRCWRRPNQIAAPARALFKFSILYLFALFLALIADRALSGSL